MRITTLLTAGCIGILSVAAAAPSAHAVPVGTLSINGAFGISGPGVDFSNAGSAVGASGVFAGIAGTPALEQPLTGGAVPNFIVFAARPNLTFDATSIAPGVFSSAACGAAAAAGQTCTAPGLPTINFANTANGSTASFSVNGVLNDAATGSSTAADITYTLQFAGQSYQSVLATIASGGSVASTYSAELAGQTGNVSLSGTVDLSNSGISFRTTPTGPNTAGVGFFSLFDNEFLVEQPSSGDFAPLPGTPGAAQDIVFGGGPIPNFLLFALAPIAGDLLGVEGGVFGSADCAAAPAVGQVCTPIGSPLNLINTMTGATLSFDIDLLMRNILSGDMAPYEGIFTAQFSHLSYQQVLDALARGASLDAVYSANFTPVSVPEPSTMVLMLSGVAIGARRLRRRTVTA